MKTKCTEEQKAACPLFRKEHFADTHHLVYPASEYKDKLGEAWRERAFNKVQTARCLHNAIHASGYIPERPERDQMLHEVITTDVPRRAIEERTRQLAIGQAVMQGSEDYYENVRNRGA